MKNMMICLLLLAAIPASAQDSLNVSVVGTLNFWNRPQGISLAGDFAYVATEMSGIRVLDISDPSVPVEVGWCATGGLAKKVHPVGDFAYVADETAGLVILDVSEPASPVVIGSSWITQAWDVTVVEDYAYVAAWISQLRVMDVSDPTAPAQVFSLGNGNYSSVEFASGYLFATNGLVEVYNLSDPDEPELVATCSTPGVAFDLFVDGDYLYVADTDEGLSIIDISEPASPALVGNCDAPNDARNVFVVGDNAYVASYFNPGGLDIIDISDPTNPRAAGNYISTGGNEGIAVRENYAYLMGGYTGMTVLDVGDPSTPEAISEWNIRGSVKSVTVQNGYAYCAGMQGSSYGMQILDVGDPETPEQYSFFSTADYGSASDVAIAGNIAFVSMNGGDGDDPGGLCAVDISNPGEPSIVGYCPDPDQGGDLRIIGGYAYVASLQSVHIIDINDPESMNSVAYVHPPGHVYEIDIDGNYMYVANWENGLRIVDISDPTDPVEVGYYELGDYTFGVAVHDGYAYMGNCANGLRVLDVGDPTEPVEVGSFATTYDAYHVTTIDGYLYLTERESNNSLFSVLDISDPVNPIEFGFYGTPWAAGGFAALDDYLCVAAATQFYIFDVSQLSGLNETNRSPGLPTRFSLSPAYPNPFNSSAMFVLGLPEASHPRITVSNTTGQIVAVLLDTTIPAGVHPLTFNASGLASGVYFVQASIPGKAIAVQKATILR